MAEIRAIALDHAFVVEAPPPLAAVLEETLAPITVQSSGAGDPEQIEIRRAGDQSWVMQVDGVDSRPMPTDRVVPALLEHVNRRAADSLVRDVPMHAAAVRHPDGGVVALAGSSGSGKSTLGAAAIRSGWGFVAEEVAAVGIGDREVRPYHRPIGLRAEGAAAIGMAMPASDWFGELYPWPVPVEARRSGGTLLGIALVARTTGDTAVDEVRPARALAELVEHTIVPSSDRIVPVFRQLDQLVRLVPVVRLSVGTPESAVQSLDELMSAWRT